ncbi:MAG: Serine/threonine protein kinase PrkC, regulator of stationary phase [Candidatus Saccharicenans subterraneus]|uniref:non-specific serine/threonine protein kinase n=1 Tax=Candidatus Saccharicenans subterraneus TaxID=2508984 RepID=A0A3E2BJJ8_9BACT|nr:MAG: Serine/threonine protein kinase PrkC, regulator of stationary phase [Candidatus Saccharicenans subterraneum]
MKCPNCGKENAQDTRFCGYCGSELQVSPDRPPLEVTKTYQTPPGRYSRGTVIAGRYEVIEFLGEGGMGAVYRVYDKKLKEVVALKFLRPEISMEPRLIERFQAELKLARQISHRHVCRLYDLGEEGFSLFITMEYIQGEDLKRFIRRTGHLNENKARTIARQVAEGLAEAHHFGIIHRDLKPHNIMIDQEGNAKIMDFGLARSVQQQGITQKGMILGTPEYMSPEQAEGLEADRRSDLYSLGVIMFEMVTGQVPFKGETPLSVAVKHKLETPPDPRELNPGLSEEMSRIILRCLEKNPDDRYQLADELILDLKASPDEQSSVQRPTTSSRKTPVVTPPATPPPPTGERLSTPSAADKEERIEIQPRGKKSRTRKFFRALLLLIIILAAGSLIKVALDNTLFRFLSGSKKAEQRVPRPTGDRREPYGIEIKKEDFSGQSQATPGVKTELPPFITSALRESYKYLQSKDPESFQKKLSELRAAIPPDSPYLQALDEIENKVAESRNLEKAGKIEESRGSLAHGETRLLRLLDQVQEKELADEARKKMEESRSRAEQNLKKGTPNLLFWVASEKEKEALAAYNKNDFSSAETLYKILNLVYTMSLKGGNEDSSLQQLRSMSLNARKSAEITKEQAKPDDTWLYDWGNDYLNQAEQEARKRAYPVAAELYIAATFLFEKARLAWAPAK